MTRVGPTNRPDESRSKHKSSLKGESENKEKMVTILIKALAYSQKTTKSKKVVADYQSSGQTEYDLFARPLSKGKFTPDPKQHKSHKFNKNRVRAE